MEKSLFVPSNDNHSDRTKEKSIKYLQIRLKMVTKNMFLILLALFLSVIVDWKGTANGSGIDIVLEFCTEEWISIKINCFDKHSNITGFHFSKGLFQQEGEVCGPCYNLKAFDCGLCAEELECVKDERADLVPDLPSRCRFKPTLARSIKRDEGE